MQEHEIVSAVKQTSGLESDDHAKDATQATLRVLGQRLAGGEPGDVASQLPAGVAEALPATGKGETFGVEEFYRRVADQEGRGCTQDGAREHARAVVATLKAGISDGEFADLEAQLPDDYGDLLATGPVTEHR